MRIISGKYRGRKLADFDGKDIRPTSDRAKEGIFSAIAFDLSGKKFLDAFCGSGAMGIEALSRGSGEVVFLDAAKSSCLLTEKNLKSIGEPAKVLNCDTIEFLKRTNEKFDIIFLDPPYASTLGNSALDIIADRDILSDDGLIIYESESMADKPESADNRPIEGLFIVKEKKYGKCGFTFYKKVDKKTALFAGSFDPVTKGHVEIVRKALKSFDRIIVALGKNENKINTFTESQRINMLEKAFECESRVEIRQFDGYLVDFLKKNRIIYNIRGIRDEKDKQYEEEMLAFNKKLFPEIKNIYIYAEEGYKNISSTLARAKIKGGENTSDILPVGVREIIDNRPI